MPSDASKEWSDSSKELEGKRDRIRRQTKHHLSEHQKYDKYETRDDARVKRAEQTIDTLWMKQRFDSGKGRQVYSHQMSVVEPVFANIGTNKRLSRFSLRTKAKVQGQSRSYCMVHNIEKLAKYGKIIY